MRFNLNEFMQLSSIVNSTGIHRISISVEGDPSRARFGVLNYMFNNGKDKGHSDILDTESALETIQKVLLPYGIEVDGIAKPSTPYYVIDKRSAVNPGKPITKTLSIPAIPALKISKWLMIQGLLNDIYSGEQMSVETGIPLGKINNLYCDQEAPLNQTEICSLCKTLRVKTDDFLYFFEES